MPIPDFDAFSLYNSIIYILTLYLINSPDVVGHFLVIALEHLLYLPPVECVLLNTYHLHLVARQFNYNNYHLLCDNKS